MPQISAVRSGGYSRVAASSGSNPAVLAFGTKMAEIDRVIGAPADADDPAVLHRDVKAAAVGAQDAGRMDPGRGRIPMMPYREGEDSDPVGCSGAAGVLTGRPRTIGDRNSACATTEGPGIFALLAFIGGNEAHCRR